MKKGSKIVISLVCILTLIVGVCMFTACDEGNKTMDIKKYVQQEESVVYFTVDADIMPNVEGKHLKDYMDALVEKELMTYVVLPGDYPMLTTINDLYADANEGAYWFIYSDDPAYTNAEWGTYEFKGVTYKATAFGIADQPLVADATYVFMISVYSY